MALPVDRSGGGLPHSREKCLRGCRAAGTAVGALPVALRRRPVLVNREVESGEYGGVQERTRAVQEGGGRSVGALHPAGHACASGPRPGGVERDHGCSRQRPRRRADELVRAEVGDGDLVAVPIGEIDVEVAAVQAEHEKDADLAAPVVEDAPRAAR